MFADFLTNRFLLVDDDQEHLESLARCLSSLGLNFISVHDGQKAVEILKSEPFDIVISDIQMPQLDGIELLRLIQKEHPRTAVILMTSFSQTFTFTDFIHEGATDYLKKPFTLDIIRAKIFRILKEREQAKTLDKRSSQLNCLYQISTIVEQKKDLLDEIFQETIDIIPSALQFPEIAMVRLCHGARTFCTAGFQPTPLSMVATIQVNGIEVGSIEVCYSREVHGTGRAPFQEEEQILLREIAKKLGRAIDRQRTEEEVKNYYANLEEVVCLRTQELQATQAAMTSVFRNIPDAILSVNGEMVVTHINDKCALSLDVEIGKVFAAEQSTFQDECCSILKNTLRNHEVTTDYRIEIRQEGQSRQVVQVSTSLLQDELNLISGALLIIHDITRLAELESQLLERRRFRQMIGKSIQLQEIYDKVRKLASVDTTILVSGESGTGKEILVETLHTSGNRSTKPMIRVNCAALPENLLESELFGHVRGAFTGAVKDREGRIQAAEGGILFLDEIGDISPRIQLKLLRFLEMKEYDRVGETQTRRADVRVFAATNADLARKIQEGLFREDLYYRLKVMVIHLPPLRERKEDIPFLVDHFLTFFNKRFNTSISGISKEVLAILMGYDWPGNIRELKHVLEHAVILSSGQELQPEHLPQELLASGPPPLPERRTSRDLTRDDLLRALRQTDGNKAKTARLLALSRATLYNKIKKFDLQSESGN